MKFGVFIDRIEQEKVSQSNFYQMVLNGLQKVRTDHEIYIVTYSRTENVKLDGVPFISIQDFIPPKIKRVQKRLAEYCLRLVFKLPRFGRLADKYKHLLKWDDFLDKALRHHNIRMIWFPTGHGAPARIPYIMTVWDCNHRVNPFLPEASYSGYGWDDLEAGARRSILRATYLITGTNRGKREVCSFYGVEESRVRVIPYPIPTVEDFKLQSFADASIVQVNNLPDTFLFYPARFLPHKNHMTLVLALARLKDQYGISLKLVLVGRDNGNKNYVFNKIDELGLAEDVIHIGVVSSTDLATLYKKAFALTYCSMNGPDNLPPLEAFSFGCPVIASKVPGSEEQLGDAALLFDIFNEEQLAEHIYKLYTNPELREELVKKGYERTSFKEEHYVAKAVELFDEFSRVARAWERNDTEILH